MRDNKTSQPAREYDDNIRKTMPFYDCFHDVTLSLIEVVNPFPATWLDTGGGTGTLVQKAAQLFPETSYMLADPSAEMVDIAKEKLAGVMDCSYRVAGTEGLICAPESFDVITAILAHHYFDAKTRRKATANCFRMMKKGGIYITFETIMPETEQGRQTGLDWWRKAQYRLGKSEVAVEKYISRFGVEFFPITLAAHLKLLRATGFASVEVMWVSGMQAAFCAIK
ncbi:MAG: class I SAM-dependent methyltransferase [Negativicutes bacterium]|nr:class I SAM-dependent methyltransferase [Negativicutes bacterium]